MLELGQIVMTAAVCEWVAEDLINRSVFIGRCVHRHETGDWGKLCEEDRKENEWAVKNGARIMSVYPCLEGQDLWIITEADRSATTVLWPGDY